MTAANASTMPAVTSRDPQRPAPRGAIRAPAQVADEQLGRFRVARAEHEAMPPLRWCSLDEGQDDAGAPTGQDRACGGRHLRQVAPARAPHLFAVGLVDLDPVTEERQGQLRHGHRAGPVRLFGQQVDLGHRPRLVSPAP